MTLCFLEDRNMIRETFTEAAQLALRKYEFELIFWSELTQAEAWIHHAAEPPELLVLDVFIQTPQGHRAMGTDLISIIDQKWGARAPIVLCTSASEPLWLLDWMDDPRIRAIWLKSDLRMSHLQSYLLSVPKATFTHTLSIQLAYDKAQAFPFLQQPSMRRLIQGLVLGYSLETIAQRMDLSVSSVKKKKATLVEALELDNPNNETLLGALRTHHIIY